MSNQRTRVKDLPGFIKDPDTGALINTDKMGYMSYIEARKKNTMKNKQIENLQNEVNELKDIVQKLIGMQNGQTKF